MLHIYWNFVKRGLSLPRVTSRNGISHETVTERDEGGWVVLKAQILRDVIIEQPLKKITIFKSVQNFNIPVLSFMPVRDKKISSIVV